MLDNTQPIPGAKRKRAIQHSRPTDEIPWTVARCNRLLRSITSRLTILRRIAKNEGIEISKPGNPPKASGLGSEKESFPTVPAQGAGTSKSHSTGQSSNADPVWLPLEDTKHSARTYAGKSKISRAATWSRPIRSEDAVGSDFRTPFLKKALKPQSETSPAFDCTPCALPQKRRTKVFPIKQTTCREEARENLVNAFDSLLSCTARTTVPSQRGAASLLIACLRKVPDYIAHDQEWAEENGEDEGFDASAETYAFLESLGADSTRGWKNLREVVRWHGVHEIVLGLQDRLLPCACLHRLLEVCVKQRAHAEIQALLKAWCSTWDKPSSSDMYDFVDLCLETNQSGLLLRQLCLFLDGAHAFPLAIYDNPRIWSVVGEALSRDPLRPDATAFLKSFMLSNARINGDFKDIMAVGQRQTRFSSLATMLTALCLSKVHTGHAFERLVSQLQHLTDSVMLALPADPLSNTRLRGFDAAKPFILGNMICTAHNPHSTTDRNSARVQRLAQDYAANHDRDVCRDGYVRGASVFLSNVAKILSQTHTGEHSDLIQVTATKFAEASKCGEKLGANSLSQLSIGAARVWAESQDDRLSWTFLEDLQGFLASDLQFFGSGITPEKARKSNKYRWEEGLAEWVIATPFGGGRAASPQEQFECHSLDDSGVVMQSDLELEKETCRASAHVVRFPEERIECCSMEEPDISGEPRCNPGSDAHQASNRGVRSLEGRDDQAFVAVSEDACSADELDELAAVTPAMKKRRKPHAPAKPRRKDAVLTTKSSPEAQERERPLLPSPPPEEPNVTETLLSDDELGLTPASTVNRARGKGDRGKHRTVTARVSLERAQSSICSLDASEDELG